MYSYGFFNAEIYGLFKRQIALQAGTLVRSMNFATYELFVLF